MATTTAEVLQQRLTKIWSDSPGIVGWLGTTDHKKLGKRYLITAIAFLLAGGINALLMRSQLTVPEEHFLSPEAYNQIMSLHGTTMIFWYASPILSGFAIYLIPLMIGARDLAFPRLNAFTYWTFVLSGVLLYISPLIGQAPRAGWFNYLPLAGNLYSPGHNQDFFALALILLTISTEGAAANFIVTVFRLRAPGMSIDRLPLFLWSTTTVSFVAIFSLPALSVALAFLELQRLFSFHFFDPSHAGDPLLWQQLFWIFGHPWVYIIFIPATGIISMVITTFSRRPIVGYTWVALATVLTGLVGFGVWVHHMFATGLPHVSMGFFSAASMTISLFTIIQIFAWVGTVWTGRPVLKTPMLFALGFIVLIVIGGLSGIMTGMVPYDWQLHDNYFIVAHIHFVLAAGNVFPVFAGFYYWLPKITGKMMNERLGKLNFWLMFFGTLVAFFTMHFTGMLGMTRRVYTYSPAAGLTIVNMITTAGAVLYALGVLAGIYNLFYSLRRGEPAGNNPWGGDTLEWSSPSPPPVYGDEHIPTVRSRNPLWDEHEEHADPDMRRVLDEERETLATTTLDANEGFTVRMAEESLLPLVSSLLMFGALLALVFKVVPLVGALGFAAAVSFGIWMWPKNLAHVE
ncbi:MAG TPA: cbb3-type cytochrome c oxidase subunit I [Gammaproteobacteria bacterium]|nr:cbb3-type cytochrome c oxidase subunit I [Gammaproteobacteria bacterium]